MVSKWDRLFEVSAVKPRIELATSTPRSVSGPIDFVGARKEKFQVCFLENHVARVRCLPETCESSGDFVRQTWSICGPSGALPDPIEGRDKDDFSGFTLPSARVFASSEGQGTTIETDELKVELSGDVLSLKWSAKVDAGASEWRSFASDSTIGGYTYVDHGEAGHYMKLEERDYIYGAGEASGRLNRRGRRFRVDCTDAMGYDAEESDPLYKHCPYVICFNQDANVAYAIIYDHLTRGVLDLGKEISAFRGSYRYYKTEAGFVEYYLVFGPTIPEVVDKVGRFLIGRPAVPPVWALGYLASSMTYTDSEKADVELEQFTNRCASYDMPCTAFHLSSGYTMDEDENRNVFTWNLKRIREPAKMFDKFHEKNIKVIPNVKPWMLASHPEYESASKMFLWDSIEQRNMTQYFWKGGAGTFMQGSYFDFTNKETFNWWKNKLKTTLLTLGADSVWNDNNEYEVDYSNALCAMGDSTNGSPIGRCGRALQTLLMGAASFEALQEHMPNKRVLNISRSGCIGTHRYCAQTWSGDNDTSFHALKFNIPMCLSVSLCGLVGAGSDIGGFAGRMVTEDLFLRWIQLGIYFPRFSIHSSSWKGKESNDAMEADVPAGTNEPWMFPASTDEIRLLLQFRAKLVTLLFSLHLEASQTSYPVMRPLVFHYATDGNERSLTESFEFLLGRDLLIAPVIAENATRRSVYFPGSEDESWCDLHTGTFYKGGNVTEVDAPLKGRTGGIPVFLRNNTGLVLRDVTFEENRDIDQSSRTVMLVSDPNLSEKEISVKWLEADGEEDDGQVYTFGIRAKSDASTVTITSYESNNSLAVTRIKVILHPSDQRVLVAPSGINVAANEATINL